MREEGLNVTTVVAILFVITVRKNIIAKSVAGQLFVQYFTFINIIVNIVREKVFVFTARIKVDAKSVVYEKNS